MYFRCLQAAILTMDEEDQDKCRTVFHKLGSGVHPTVEEIVALIPLFQEKPFHISQIRATHVVRPVLLCHEQQTMAARHAIVNVH